MIKIFCLIGALCLPISALSQTDDAVGAVELVEGAATVIRNTAIPVTDEMDVFIGDIFEVPQGSHVKVVLDGENELDIPGKARIKIEKYLFEQNSDSNSLIEVFYGMLRSTVKVRYDGDKSKFEVKTPTVVTGVRGTDFLASYDEASQDSEITSFEGEVEVSSKDTGERTRLRPGDFIQRKRGARLGMAKRMGSDRWNEIKGKTRREPNFQRRERFKQKIQERRQMRQNSGAKRGQQMTTMAPPRGERPGIERQRPKPERRRGR